MTDDSTEILGTYSIDRKPVGTAGPAYTMGLRNKWKAGDHRRGPGSYNPASISPSAPAYSMGRRTKPKSQDSWERGPGSYDVCDTKRGPSFSLGTRESLKTTAGSDVPGPGSYNTDNTWFTKTAAPSYSLGGRAISNYTTHSPGPGAYDINRNRKGGPSYSISSRPAESTNTGVGSTYGRSNMTTAPSFSFGARSSSHVERTPGPGAYNTDVNRNSGPAFSITSRGSKNKLEKDLNPGPGAYDATVNGRTGPSFSMAHKRRVVT